MLRRGLDRKIRVQQSQTVHFLCKTRNAWESFALKNPAIYDRTYPGYQKQQQKDKLFEQLTNELRTTCKYYHSLCLAGYQLFKGKGVLTCISSVISTVVQVGLYDISYYEVFELLVLQIIWYFIYSTEKLA